MIKNSARTQGLRLRRTTSNASDRDSLFAMYAEALRPNIESSLGWHTDSQRSRFDALYPSASIKEICLGNARVGFLALERRLGSLHVRLLVLVPQSRGKGLGSEVLRLVEFIATRTGLDVSLSAFSGNERAISFYQRLGYQRVDADDYFVSLIKRTGAAR